ncbi:hypothetical protein CONCODRAFT_4562 [Conidiobolus coronatus NRRL 28638]|uniref:RRM domain-containing protein n=1 Tax=Conidiobolus coronatus (strain ATCC 28846 / CBS 209.66 / NRRL 28638) TaxID=796925 RepID=A0A137PC64_CONC2|nr:hypothetical protein CONCODRAFT_4562 [Conidiobolus coronatus NRRL 28638]|eukprot:KXN72594.1 hypothetical protein CONCODRAFT_4562 [Conidiobolus coronatus NRRL 28638]
MNPFQNNHPPLPPPHHRHHNLPPPPFLPQFPIPPPPVPIATQKVTLFVKNLPPISKEEIVHYFMTLRALEIRLMDSKKMKNSGFVDFQSLQLAEAAINYLNNNLWFGLKVKASLSKSNNNNDNNSNDKSLIEHSTSKVLQTDKFNSKPATGSDDLAKFEPISKKLG